ncbi:uncharacterized protein LOC124283646 [Haliotis rubra]|uniref:uncharacterized protein LOC124283646 n=1 Tax=Haliotis rubra TaxID=36100 RepID=UPI001EE58720|nr:uncharacterized protein LOC124283646 [Haliotis rubra]
MDMGQLSTFMMRVEMQLSGINQKLERLDAMDIKIKNLETMVGSNDSKLNSLGLQMHENFKSTSDQLRTLQDNIDNNSFNVGIASDKISRLEDELARQRDIVLDLQSRSMRDNLLIVGVGEERRKKKKEDGTDGEEDEEEDTQEVVRNLFKEKLQIAEGIVQSMTFGRVHRVYNFRNRQPRTIVVNFKNHRDRDLVKICANKLKRPRMYINEQYPPEINEQRRQLL